MPLIRPHHQTMEIADGKKILVDRNPRDAFHNGFQIIEPERAERILKDAFPDVSELKITFKYPIRQDRVIWQEVTGYIGGKKSILVAGIDERMRENLNKRFLYGTQKAGLGWTQHTFATGNRKRKNPAGRKPLFHMGEKFLCIKSVHLSGNRISHIHQNHVVAHLRATHKDPGIPVKQPDTRILQRWSRCKWQMRFDETNEIRIRFHVIDMPQARVFK